MGNALFIMPMRGRRGGAGNGRVGGNRYDGSGRGLLTFAVGATAALCCPALSDLGLNECEHGQDLGHAGFVAPLPQTRLVIRSGEPLPNLVWVDVGPC